MSNWATPCGRSASITAFIAVGSDPTVPASPTPLTPSPLLGEGTVTVSMTHVAEQAGARHRVVHEAAGDDLRVAVIHAEFAEHLAQALRQPAQDLALQQGEVYDRAAIVDGHVAQQVGDPRLGVDLDLGHVRAGRVGLGRLVVDRGVEPAGEPGCELHKADAAIRSGDGEAATRILDVSPCRFERLYGAFHALVQHGGGGDRAAGAL